MSVRGASTPTYNRKVTAECIRLWQRQKSMMGKDIAKQIGITKTHFSAIINSKTTGSVEVLARICNALGHTLSELFAAQNPGVPANRAYLSPETLEEFLAAHARITEQITESARVLASLCGAKTVPRQERSNAEKSL